MWSSVFLNYLGLRSCKNKIFLVHYGVFGYCSTSSDCLKDGWDGDLFTIHDKKQVLFKDGTSGTFDFDGMWQVMTEHNLIVNLK